MFNKDFYPTPGNVIEQMVAGLDLFEKNVLEPSAGKGNIVDALNEFGAKVWFCEIEPKLTKTIENANFIKSDFLKVSAGEISHIDYIIMNPPFSKGVEHILHAWEIAPAGCEIITLINSANLDNYRRETSKRILKNIISQSGVETRLGDCFSTSERKTDVNVSKLHLYKPGEGHDEFKGYFDMTEEEEAQENGIMQYTEVREIVNRYVTAVKKFDSVNDVQNEINALIAPLQSDIEFSAKETSGGHTAALSREDFKNKLQKSAWNAVFSKMKMDRFLTSAVSGQINNFIHKQENVPFTVKNVYKMIEMIIGTQKSRMYKVVEDVFDKLTSYHKENRMYREGWKTNDQYRVNQKFILPGAVTLNFQGQLDTPMYSYGDNNAMTDITKAICYITGKKYERTMSFGYVLSDREIYSGKWFDFGFFTCKGFKKGTLHCKFKDEKIWNMFNEVACQAKGFDLAEKYTSDFRAKETDVKLYK